MVKVKIKNFQSISNINFDIDGFTLIIGKNNLGKSAIIRAIDAALTNRVGNEFIQWGKKRTEVSLYMGDLNIEWKKGSSATYSVNDKSYSKLNRNIPEPITKAGFKKMIIGEHKLSPLIAHQFDELFLLDKPASVITDVLSVIYKLNIINDADSLCQKELKSKKSLLKTREKDLQKLQNEMEKYDEFENIKKEMESVNDLNVKKEKFTKELDEINFFINELSQVKLNLKKFEKIKSVKIPSINKPLKQFDEYQWLIKTVDVFNSLLKRVKSTGEITKLKIPVYEEAQKIINELTILKYFSGQLKSTGHIIKTSQTLINDFKIIKDCPEKISKLDKLYKEVTQIKELKQSLNKLSLYVNELKIEKDNYENELNTALSEKNKYNICPACERPLEINNA